MKKKSKHAPIKRKKEIRFHKIDTINMKGVKRDIFHPAYIFIEKGNVYIYVTITHSKEIEGHILIKLRKNPNPRDNNDAYYVAEIKTDTKDTFGKRRNWKLDPLDDAEIRLLFNKKR